jgi:hypothetical protein
VGSFSIVAIGTYAASTNFHQLRDTTFCRKQEVSLSAKLTFQMEKKTVSNLGRGAGDGLESNRKPKILGQAGQMNQEKRAGGGIDDVVGGIIVRGHGSVRRTMRAQHTSSILLD